MESQQQIEELKWETIREEILPKFDELGVDSVCFCGGEPTLQWDLLIRLSKIFAKKRYEFLILTTNTINLTEEMLKEWKNAAKGVKDLILAVPVDSLDPDKVRELRPSSSNIDVLESVKKAADIGIKLGMWVSISTVITKTNFDEIRTIAEFVRSKGKKAISEMYPCYLEGRARDNKDLILTKEQFREFDCWRLTNLSKNILFWDFMPFPVNPAYWYSIREKALTMGWSEGCPAVTRYLHLDVDGTVYPCSFLRTPLGNLVTDTVEKILSHPLARSIANRDVTGNCGKCKYHDVCGGCRARAFTETGDPLGGIPSCEGGPEGHPLEESFTNEVRKSYKAFRWHYRISGLKRRLSYLRNPKHWEL